MSLTNFPNGISSFGAPVVPVGGFNGTHFWVKPASGDDAKDGKSPSNAFKTLAHALAKATANKGDCVHLVSESNTASATTDYQSVALDWNKDGVHLIGENNGSLISARSRISNLSTATAIVNGLVIISANNCLIENIEIFQGAGSTNPTGASIAMVVSGQRNRIVNCQISGNGDVAGTLDDATSRSLKVSGSENLFQHCYIGLDTVIRATATAEVEISAGARNMFEDCYFNTYSSASGFLMVTIAAGIDRFVWFNRCAFVAVQNITSAVAPTSVMDAASVNGNIHIMNPYVSGFTNITAADAARVKALGFNGLATGHLVGISQAVDVA